MKKPKSKPNISSRKISALLAYALEPLEWRVLLASTPFYSVAARVGDYIESKTLVIHGDARPDRIDVSKRNAWIRVYHNGELQKYKASRVKQIEIRSGAGNDVIDATGVKIPVYVDAGTGNDSVESGGANDTLTGGSGKDTLRGGDGDDWIKGSGSNDQEFGDGGNDTVYGGEGEDWLDGGGEVDRLLGDSGDDTLAGAGSADKLRGGEGADRLLGNMTLGTMSGEIRKPDGTIDIDATIASLSKLNINTYYYLIWHGEHDWDQFPAFADAAKKIGITVWAYVVPWTETPIKKDDPRGFSEPFRTDYKLWAKEVATLSLTHTNVAGLIIDDFYINTIPNDLWDNVLKIERFSPGYVEQMVDDAKAINPRFQFQPLMYFQTPWQNFLDQYAGLIDGVVVAYPKSEAGIDNAMTYLRGERHGPSAMILLDRNRETYLDLGGKIMTNLNVTDPTEARMSFYYDATNSALGNTGEEVMRVTLDGQPIWERKMDSGDVDKIIDIDLSQYITVAGTHDLELGMYCTKGGIPLKTPVEGRFDDIRIYGTGEDPSQFTTSLQWTTKQQGKFLVTLTDARNGDENIHVPVTLMPAGLNKQYKLRYGDKASVKKLSRKINLSLSLLEQGVVQGVVPWSTPLHEDNSYYQNYKELLSAVPVVSLENGTLRVNATEAADIIGMTERNGTVKVRCNGVLRTFPLCNITRVEVYAADGADQIDTTGISVPAYIEAGPGDDNVKSGAGDDTIDGDGGSDQIKGGDGNDSILGGRLSDKLFGEAGNDTIDGGEKADLIDGGTGDDVALDDVLDTRVSVQTVV